MSEETAPPIVPIVTHCRDCVFALYDGDTQEDDGCSLGRIAAFEGAGATVTGLDDGKLRWLSVDRFCNACHTGGSPHLKDVPRHQWEGHVRSLVRPRVAFIIYACESTTDDDLRVTLRSLPAGPSQVVVAFPEGVLTPPRVIGVLRAAKLGCPWEAVRAEPADERQKALYAEDRFRLIDLAVQKLDPKKTTWYATARAGSEVDTGLIDRLDHAYNVEMIPVAAVTDGDEYCVLLNVHRHASVAGNRAASMLVKFPEIVEFHGGRFVVLRYEELPCE